MFSLGTLWVFGSLFFVFLPLQVRKSESFLTQRFGTTFPLKKKKKVVGGVSKRIMGWRKILRKPAAENGSLVCGTI